MILLASNDAKLRRELEAIGFSVENPISSLDDSSEFFLEDWLSKENDHYQAAVIDMDDTNLGLMACRALRLDGNSAVVIGILSKDAYSVAKRIEFLSNGGDDLMQGPVDPQELAAVINACCRRTGKIQDSIVTILAGESSLIINMTRRTIHLNTAPINLAASAEKILFLLARNLDKVVTKDMILAELYTFEAEMATEKIVDVFICKIRARLKEVSPDIAKGLQTVWGRGYRLVSDTSVGIDAPNSVSVSNFLEA